MLELGVAYYPDYLSEGQLARLPDGRILPLRVEQRIALDLDRMATDGLSCLRVGEFSWSHVEPAPGALRTDRFLLTLDLAARRGLKVIFCTPTAAPPKWLVDRQPDLLPVTRSGATIPFGSRRHYDVLNAAYSDEAQRITAVYAEAFGAHAAVVGWQVDNELGHHGSAYSFTSSAAVAFRAWLSRRFDGDIAALNEAWFTCFWSQHYRTFAEVALPLAAWSDHNPQMELDFRRFMSEAYAAFQRRQADTLRRGSPGRFITHNFVPMLFDLCPWRMSEDLDVVGYDHYQVGPLPNPAQSAAQYNLMRSLKRRRFLVLEQQPVQVNWQAVNRRFAVDWLFLWGAQAALLGASAMYYFSWQRFPGGPEQYHDALVPHDLRVPRSLQERVLASKRRFFQELAADLGLAELPLPRRDVLILLSAESFWAHDVCAQSTLWSGPAEVERFQTLCSACGLGVDMAPDLLSVPLAGYRVVVLAGYAFELSREEQAALRAFLAGGGKVISSPRTGVKQRDNKMSLLPFSLGEPGDFYFEDYGALAADETETVALVTTPTQRFCGRTWAERIVVPADSPWEVVARFAGGLYAEAPAMLIRRTPSGGAHLHLAFCPELTDSFADALWDSLGLDVQVRAPLASGLQLIPMGEGPRSLLGVLNFSELEASVLVDSGKASARLALFQARCDTNLDLETSVRQQPTDRGAASVLVAGRSVLILEVI